MHDGWGRARGGGRLLERFEAGGALNSFIEGTLNAYRQPGPVPYTPVTGLIDGLGRIGQGFTASGLRLATAALSPLRLIELAQAIAAGNGAEGLAALVENIVDAPLWVVDPALYGLRDALPAPLGGADGIIENFRNQLWKLTQEINSGLQDPAAAVQGFIQRTVDAFERPGPVAYQEVTGPIDGISRIAEGAIATALRITAAAVLGPVGVVQAAVAFAQGDTAEALDLVENIVDGPLWAVDPALYGLRDALPAPLGGPNAFVENLRNGIWAATERINGTIRQAVERTQAPAAEDEAPEESARQEPGSLPNLQARIVNLSEQAPEKEGLDNLPQQDQRKDSKLDNTSATDPGTKQAKQQQDRNVVRNSLKFSPGAGRTGQKPTGGTTEEVVTSTSGEQTATTTPSSTAGGGTTSASTPSASTTTAAATAAGAGTTTTTAGTTGTKSSGDAKAGSGSQGDK